MINQNKMTAVGFLEKEITEIMSYLEEDGAYAMQGVKEKLFGEKNIIQQAKEMEKNVATEYAEFCIRCDRANLKQVKFEDWKKSWDETLKSE